MVAGPIVLDIHAQGIVLVVKRVVCAMIGSATWQIRGIIFILQCISMKSLVLLGFVTQSVWLNPLKFMDLVFLREYGKLESWFQVVAMGIIGTFVKDGVWLHAPDELSPVIEDLGYFMASFGSTSYGLMGGILWIVTLVC